LEHIYESSGLKNHHGKENNERSRSRVENLDELTNAIKQFEETHDPLSVVDDYIAEDQNEQSELLITESNINTLGEFLSHAVLESSEKQGEEWDDCVQLMTLHSAKGLEFNSVFLAGLEQGLFPHRMSMEASDKLEEERRLCYVGITRAMKTLHLSFADSRSMHGKTEYRRPSQFLTEIPPNLLLQVKATSTNTINTATKPFNNSYSSTKSTPAPAANISDASKSGELYTGKAVVHKKFGQGVVLAIEGSGAKQRVQVHFSTAGTRWLLASIAKLTV